MKLIFKYDLNWKQNKRLYLIQTKHFDFISKQDESQNDVLTFFP